MRFPWALLLFLLAACRAEPDRRDDPPDPAPVDVEKPPENAGAPTAAPEPARSNARPSGLVPSALRGRWTGVGDDCSDKAAATELEITPARLIFHESVGTVTAVQPKSDGSIDLKADFTGEGASWTRLLMVRMSPDGRLIITNDGAAEIRKRCDTP